MSRVLFLVVLATIPIQLNKYFFPDSSFVLGIPIDYKAITLYFSDIAIVLYLFFFFKAHRKNFSTLLGKIRPVVIILTIFNLYFLLNALITSASFFFNIKLLEFSLFALCASVSFSDKRVQKYIPKILSLTILWQSLVIIVQFVFQRSLGLWFIGERSFDASTVSIAHIDILGKHLLRPYGTFPHPNVAGAFLVIFFILLIAFTKKSSKKLSFTFQNPPTTLLISSFALLLTFSKSAILTLFVAFALLLKSTKYIALLIIAFLGISVIFYNTLSDLQIDSISERLTLATAAVDIFANHPIFGVGSGNFISELAKQAGGQITEIRLLQPVHNVFLLILAENGVIGLGLFSLLVVMVVKNSKSRAELALVAVLTIFATVDHFLWTIHQGQLLLWLTIGYLLSQIQSQAKTTE